MKKTLRNIALGTALAASAAGISLYSGSGCTKPEYEQRISRAIAKPEHVRERKDTINFYRNIDPKNLTEDQKESLRRFNENPQKYLRWLETQKSNIGWMNPNALTDRDRIYLDVASSIYITP